MAESSRQSAGLCANRASNVAGEVIYVDAGYHILGMPEPPEKWE